MTGSGEVVQFYTGTAPVRSALENFDFPKDHYSNVHAYPINKFNALRKLETAKETGTAEKTEVNSRIGNQSEGLSGLGESSGASNSSEQKEQAVPETSTETKTETDNSDNVDSTKMDTTESSETSTTDNAEAKNSTESTETDTAETGNQIGGSERKEGGKDARSLKRKQEVIAMFCLSGVSD